MPFATKELRGRLWMSCEHREQQPRKKLLGSGVQRTHKQNLQTLPVLAFYSSSRFALL